MTKPLTIYKASAGSGKTFQLAVEYITLLVKNPEDYRRILAVTFTNKATAEMKLRILSQLYGIARGLPSSEDYLKHVRENVKSDLAKEAAGRNLDDVIRQRASAALSLLTHNYNYFRVQTIDAFFQTVLRNLARELDLSANLRISLNNNEIEEMAVDSMIERLRPGANVLKWIGEFIQSKMDENKSWYVINSIKDFGKNIFKEFYQHNSKSLNERLSADGFFDNFVKTLRQIIDTSKQEIIKSYQDIIDVLQAEGLDDPQWFSGGASKSDLAFMRKVVQGVFDDEPTTPTRQSHIDNPDKWIAATKKKLPECQRLVALAQSRLCDMLRTAEETRIKKAYDYKSAQITLRHLNELRLLRAIEQAVNGENQEANRFLLSNTQHLLQTMIDGSDTPFIFEKIGAMLRHIMIDEFQDTSTVQWLNFKVLLDSCLSQAGSHSLIVGDVKQSIYRWRSGDWNLLNNMQEDALTKIIPMSVNYRSSKQIIEFNNAFFAAAKVIEKQALDDLGVKQSDQLLQAYEGHEQEVAKKNLPGEVKVTLLKYDKQASHLYDEATMEQITNRICELVDEGTQPSDIAILTRKNDTILDIANHFAHDERLLERKLRLVSDEAFRLDASFSVRLLINALHVVAHPEDALAKATLIKNYQVYVLNNPADESQLLLEPQENLLPIGFDGNEQALASMPLLDLVDHLYELFSLQQVEGQTAYVCAFHDLLSEYLQDHTTDIDELTAYWEDTLAEKKIQCDDVDGIRILTIYKSKGLEYKHIIVPYCDWTLEQQSLLWTQRQHPAPYDALPIIPIDLSKTLLNTVYAEDYREEHFQLIVDNLNVLYVAFTRARETLFVIGKLGANENSRSCVVEAAIRQLAAGMLEGSTITESDVELNFSFGQRGEVKKKSHETSDNIFEQKPTTQLVKVETFKQSAAFRQSNKSRDFVSAEDAAPQESYIQRGCVLHEIFSHIRTLSDVEPAINQLTLDGVLDSSEDTLDDLRTQISQCLKQPEAREWFSPRWTLFNECTILTTNRDGQIIEHRPDRVMKDGTQTIVVDFKFGHPRKEYQAQVAEYARLLKDMGEENVRAYLWYVTDERVEEVTVNP